MYCQMADVKEAKDFFANFETKKRARPVKAVTPKDEFFVKADPEPSPIHPYAETEYYEFSPPIPEFNFIIDPKTLEIIEDLTGKP